MLYELIIKHKIEVEIFCEMILKIWYSMIIIYIFGIELLLAIVAFQEDGLRLYKFNKNVF